MYRTMSLFAGLLVAAPAAAQTVTIGFENLTPTRPSPSGSAGFYENGQNLSGSFASGGATFNNFYDATYGEYWEGWSYSTVTDTTTPTSSADYPLRQYAAYTPTGGGGASGSATYAVAYAGSPIITLPADYRPDSIQITNTTYDVLSLSNGDQFAKKFGGASGNDPDFFKLTITGTDAANNPTGSVEFYLADYRFADNARDYVVKDWTTVDLSGLGSATRKLAFEFTSSDTSVYSGVTYINTPTYFAVDDLIVSAIAPVPEPATAGLAAAVGLGAGWRRWRRT